MPPPIDRKRGSKIGAYTLLRPLGSGGNAEVWSARALDRSVVALKILRRSTGANSEPLQRLRSEIEALQRIGLDSNVLPLLDFSLPERPSWDSPAWLVTKVAIPIARALREVNDLRRVVEAMRSIAGTLERLRSSHGIYHRDLKPENLYLLDEEWCLGDFGLVTYPEKQSITAAGRHIGPFYYLAPELLSSATREPGPADVYALAKTFWVLATGQRYPLPGHLTPDIEQFRIGSFRAADRTRQLDLLISRATHPEVKRRPSMSDMAAELSAWLNSADQSSEPRPFDLATLDQLSTLIGGRLQVHTERDRVREYVRSRLLQIRDQMRPIIEEISAHFGIKPEIDVTSFGDAPTVRARLELGDTSFHSYTTFAFHIPDRQGGPSPAGSLVLGVGVPVDSDQTMHVFGGCSVVRGRSTVVSATLTNTHSARIESASEDQAVAVALAELRATIDPELRSLQALLAETQ